MNLTDLMHGEKFIGRFFYIFHGSWLIKQLTLPLQQHYLNSFLIKLRRKNDDLAPNVELSISAPRQSQKSFLKRKDPITGNSFILISCTLKCCASWSKRSIGNTFTYADNRTAAASSSYCYPFQRGRMTLKTISI